MEVEKMLKAIRLVIRSAIVEDENSWSNEKKRKGGGGKEQAIEEVKIIILVLCNVIVSRFSKHSTYY